MKELCRNFSLNMRHGKSAPDFWALGRMFEQAMPDAPRLGFAKSPKEENVRFGQKPFLHFSGNEIAEIVSGADTTMPPTVEALVLTYFFGLLGINGPMPLEFTSYVFQRSYNHYDNTWRRFLDIIHHRFHTLYYRAFAGYEQSISFDRKDDDPMRSLVQSLAGIPAGTDLPAALATGNASEFAFALKTRAGLETILKNVLHNMGAAENFQVKVEDHQLAVFRIHEENHAFLGKKKSSVLGSNMQIGRTFISITHAFNIRIGPLSYNAYCLFIEEDKGIRQLASVAKLFLDRPLRYNTVFILESKTIPAVRLGNGDQHDTDSRRLGRNCWLGRQKNEYTIHTIAISAISRRLHIHGAP
jgi:type VI secretion system ImpH/TssG family protein